MKFKSFLFNRISLLIFTVILLLINVTLSSVLPMLSKFLFDSLKATIPLNLISKIAILFIGIILLQLIMNFFVSLFSAKWTQNLVYEIRSKLIEKYLDQHVKQGADAMQILILSDSENIANGFLNILLVSISSVCSIVIYLVYIYYLDIGFFFVVLLTAPFVYISSIHLNNLSKKKYEQIQNEKENIIQGSVDINIGFDFIKIYAIQKQIITNFNNALYELLNVSVKFTVITTFLKSTISLITIVIPFVLLIVGSIKVIHHNMTVGSLIAVYSYISLVYPSIGQLVGLRSLQKQLSVSIGRIDDKFCEFEENIAYSIEKNKMYKFIDSKNETCLVEGKQILKTFGSRQIFEDANFIFEEGINLVTGANGSGKSTLGRIIANLDYPDNGKIIFKNINSIQYIPQETYLFEGTFEDNIKYGVENFDLTYCRKICRILDIHLDFPTVLNVKQMSTGEIQKVKLLHALMFKPNLLIIDEAISNLDMVSKENIVNYLTKMENTCIIVITHEKIDFQTNYKKFEINKKKLTYNIDK